MNGMFGAGGSCGERVFLITFSFIIGFSIVYKYLIKKWSSIC